MNTFLKYIFVVINLVFVAVGVFCFGFILWVDRAPIISEMLTVVKLDTALFYCGVLLGAFLVFVGICGAIGSFYEKKWILAVYLVIVLLFIVWELATVIYAAVEGSDQFVHKLEELWTILHNDTKFIVQDVFNCCGYLNASEWNERYDQSCLNLTILNATVPWDVPCSESILTWFRDNMLVVAGALIATILFQVFQAVTTGLLILTIAASSQKDETSTKLSRGDHDDVTQQPSTSTLTAPYQNQGFVDEKEHETGRIVS